MLPNGPLKPQANRRSQVMNDLNYGTRITPSTSHDVGVAEAPGFTPQRLLTTPSMTIVL